VGGEPRRSGRLGQGGSLPGLERLPALGGREQGRGAPVRRRAVRELGS
jgi:hypothetical protein